MGDHLLLCSRQFFPDISEQFRIVFLDLLRYRVAFHRGLRQYRIHHLFKGGYAAAEDQIHDRNSLRDRHAGISDHKSILMSEGSYMADQLRV